MLSSSILVVKLGEGSSRIANVDLQLEAAFARVAHLLGRTTDDSIATLLNELDLGAESLEVVDTGLGDHPALINLPHQLALFSGNHPADQVLALE